MKILTREEEEAHNKATWYGGAVGGLSGLAVGTLGVWAAHARFHAFRALNLPLKAGIVTATTIFGGEVTADRYSRNFERHRHADADYINRSEAATNELEAQKSLPDKVKQFVSKERYPIVFGSWVVSMAVAFGLVSRNRHLTGAQKLVQARVYAQGLTLAVLVASFALEGNDLRSGKGRWETVKVLDPDDPEHKRLIEKRIHHESYTGEDQWMDMLEAQESRMKARGQKVRDKDEHQQSGSKKKQEQAQ